MDPRCFIDCNSKIRLVQDLPEGSFVIEGNSIDLLEKDLDEMLVVETYDLHPDLHTLQTILDKNP